jgi:hypothetical protein
MYFWRIEHLKTTLATRPLSEREALPYLVVYVVLYSVAAYVPLTEFTVWDTVEGACSVLIAAIGTIYIYRQNGGANGQHFLQRYFAIGWVVTVRWLAVVLLLVLAPYVALAVLDVITDRIEWYDRVLILLAELGLYWRIAHHVRDLAQRTPA